MKKGYLIIGFVIGILFWVLFPRVKYDRTIEVVTHRECTDTVIKYVYVDTLYMQNVHIENCQFIDTVKSNSMLWNGKHVSGDVHIYDCVFESYQLDTVKISCNH